MSDFHQKLIKFRNALGYKQNDDGVCSLYAQMAINAFLINDIESFYQHTAYIENNAGLPDFFKQAKQAKSIDALPKKLVSEEELQKHKELLEAIAFMESGELYLFPQLYYEMFNKSLTQTHIKEISVLTQSHALAQLGGRALIHSFSGIYIKKELISFIALLNKLAMNAKQDFALSVSSFNHNIAICYSFQTKTWQLIDANQPSLKPLLTQDVNFEELLAEQILIAFNSDNVTAFHTEIWTTGLLKEAFQKHVNAFCKEQEEIYSIVEHAQHIAPDRITLASIAACNNDTKVLTALIEAKNIDGSWRVDLNQARENGATPALLAAQNGHTGVLKLLIEAKNTDGTPRVNLNQATILYGETPAFLAAQDGHTEALKLLIEAKNTDETPRVDINQATKNGATPALIVTKNGHTEALKLLLEAKNIDGTLRVDLKQVMKYDEPPVFIAIRYGKTEALKLLIEAKNIDGTPRVDFNQVMGYGLTPTFFAIQEGDTEVLRLLIDAKNIDGSWRIDLNQAMQDGATPLFIAAQLIRTKTLRLLIEAKNTDGTPRVELNQAMEDGTTPAFITAKYCFTEALRLLIEAKNTDGTPRVDLNRARSDGVTPAFAAAQNGHKDIIIELLKQGVDMNLLLKMYPENLRCLVVRKELIERMNQFLENKPPRQEILMTPRDIALIMGNHHIAELLYSSEPVGKNPNTLFAQPVTQITNKEFFKKNKITINTMVEKLLINMQLSVNRMSWFTLGSEQKIVQLIAIKTWLEQHDLNDQTEPMILALIEKVCAIKRNPLGVFTPASQKEFGEMLKQNEKLNYSANQLPDINVKNIKNHDQINELVIQFLSVNKVI